MRSIEAIKAAFFGQATPFSGGVILNGIGDTLTSMCLSQRAISQRQKNYVKSRCCKRNANFVDDGSSTPMMSMAPIIQANLAAIGFDAKIETMEVPRYWDEVWGKVILTNCYVLALSIG